MSFVEEQTECPLCMEPLEMDDINFFPCTCGYQICRFCWHRIRTDENGLCPACRKQYPEDPAAFKPLTEDELQRIKKERRQKDLQRKQKAAENRKHLANVRVVQKNLVFVVGLSQRLADPEVLKKSEYFGKFGKIHKVVINHSTSYAGAQSSSQGPSASAYVTYQRPEDTLRAIQAVNNIHVDGRTLKASLGTTKYCSHFLRGSQCPKPDCMYLHELGEEAASFTKEEMQQGKHQEYELKLYEQFMNCQNLNINNTIPGSQNSKGQSRKKNGSPETIGSCGSSQGMPGEDSPTGTPPNSTHPDTWPSLQMSSSPESDSPETVMAPLRSDLFTNGNSAFGNGISSCSSAKQDVQNAQNRAPGHHRNRNNSEDTDSNSKTKTLPHSRTQNCSNGQDEARTTPPCSTSSPSHMLPHTQPPHIVTSSTHAMSVLTRASPLYNNYDSMSLFSSGTGFGGSCQNKPPIPHSHNSESIQTTEIPETITVESTTDWQAAFGFKPASTATSTLSLDSHDDDLGFDPWNESNKALTDLIQNEASVRHHLPRLTNPPPGLPLHQAKTVPPPGLLPHPNQIGAYGTHMPSAGYSSSKIMGLMQMPPSGPHHMHMPNSYDEVMGNLSLGHKEQPHQTHQFHSQNHDAFNMIEWQEELRALLPNINIHFGKQPYNSSSTESHQQQHKPTQHMGKTVNQMGDWFSGKEQTLHSGHATDPNWDPAIVTSGSIADVNSVVDEQPPHWMASLQHLTEESSNHRLPFVQQFPTYNTGANWATQTQHPPPGFQTQMRTPSQVSTTDAHQLKAGVQ